MVSTLDSIFDAKKLPSLKTILNVPNSVKVGTVSALEMEATYMVAHNDMGKLIQLVKQHNYLDATELTIQDALKVSAIFGVPGTGVAATVAPYLFDILNAELRGQGRINKSVFIDALEHSHSNMAQIMKAIDDKKYEDAVQLGLNDVLDAAFIAGGGPYALGAKVVVNVGFAIAKDKNVEDFFVNIGMDIAELGSIFDDLDKTLRDLEGNPEIQYDSGKYVWDPFKG